MDSLAETLKTTCEEMKIQLYDQADIKEIHTNSVTIQRNDIEQILSCDTVVVSLGLHPDPKKLDVFRFLAPETYIIGDANTVGNIRTANMDAFNVCVEI